MPSSRSSYGYRVKAVIQSACRRRFLVLAVEQLGLALSMILGGGILMLLLGTQILSWYWLVLLGVSGLAVASIRVRARMLTNYRVAQLLDHQLRLSDSLSTAWFLLSGPDAENPISRFQIQHAEAIAGSVRPAKAFEFRGRKLWAVTGALAGIAFGLFAIRYLVTSSLSLEQALMPIQLSAVFERMEKSFAPENHQSPNPGGIDQQQAKSPGLAEPQRNDGRNGLLGSENPKSGQSEALSGESSIGQTATQATKAQDKETEGRDGKSSASRPNSGHTTEKTSENQGNSQQAASSKEQQGESQQGSSGLMDKMKDALSSLMAKMRPSADARKPSQNGEPSSEDQKGGDQAASSKDQNSKSQQDARNEKSERQSSEGQAQGQTTEKAQASQGRNSDQSPDRKDSDAHSGVGRQDGDKARKEAEQLQAMGKLAEIIGKRSANVTGDMTVETPSGKQQLKTEYSQRAGHHSDLGGEINRDEIPLMYQQYIREYMEQVRKQQAKSGQ